MKEASWFCKEDTVWVKLRMVESLEVIVGTNTFDRLQKSCELAGIKETIGGTLGTTLEGLG